MDIDGIDAKIALCRSICNALQVIQKGKLKAGGEQEAAVIFKLVSSLRCVDYNSSKLFKDMDLGDVDVFSKILANSTLDQSLKVDLITILFSYFAIYPDLHILISNSIGKWSKSSLLTQSATEDQMKMTSDNLLCCYDLVALVESYDSFTPDLLAFLDLQSLDSLQHYIHFWETRPAISNEVISNKYLLDLHIAVQPASQLTTIQNNKFLWYKFLQRLSLLSRWCDTQWHKVALDTLLEAQFDQQFNLLIVMELIDHPEFNLVEEPKLCHLLFIALSNIKNSKVTNLHETLSQINSTQSLQALVNLLQFTLTKYLIQFFSTQTSKNTKWQLPSWFTEWIVPAKPPISKSLFVFNNDDEKFNMININDHVRIILDCLNTSITINNKILGSYRQLALDPMSLDGNESVNHLLVRNYFQLFFIPMFATLALSEQLRVSHPDFALSSKQLFANLVKLIENLINLKGNTAVYHFLKFISKISVEDLVLQKISLNLLNHLFFHQINNSTYVRNLCINNKLSLETLKTYIDLWNDGTEKYSQFYDSLFHLKQPQVEQVTVSYSDLAALLPDYEFIVDKAIEKSPVHAPIPQKHQPTIQNHQRQQQQQQQQQQRKYSNHQSNKFDAYSSSTFVPSTASTTSTVISTGTTNNGDMALQNNTYGFQQASENYQRQTPSTNNNNGNNYLAWTSSTTDNNLSATMDSFTSFNTPLTMSSMQNLQKTNNDFINSTPKTPTNATGFSARSSVSASNPWNDSPISGYQNRAVTNKIVNTGKNYILGGHNRVKNNSRAQSIHIDKFVTNE